MERKPDQTGEGCMMKIVVFIIAMSVFGWLLESCVFERKVRIYYYDYSWNIPGNPAAPP